MISGNEQVEKPKVNEVYELVNHFLETTTSHHDKYYIKFDLRYHSNPQNLTDVLSPQSDS
jgi:hypothetical protein